MAHEYYFNVNTDDDKGTPFGPANKDNMDISRLIVDFTSWLDPSESITRLDHFMIKADPPQTAPPWQANYPLDETSSTTIPEDTYPLVFARQSIIHGGKAIELDIAAGTPGLTYAVSFSVTAGISLRRRLVDILMVVDMPLNPDMVALSDGVTPSYTYPLVINNQTFLPYGFAGRVHVENTTGTQISLTLPPSPVLGQVVSVADTGMTAYNYPMYIIGDATSPNVGDTTATNYLSNVNGFDLTFEWTGTYWHLDDVAYLPLTGGGVSGTVTIGNLVVNPGNILTTDLAATGNITATGAIGGGTIGADTLILSAGDVTAQQNIWALTGAITSSFLHSTGTATVDLDFNVGGSIDTSFYKLRSRNFATQDVGNLYNVIYDPLAVANIWMYTDGTNNYDNTTHYFRTRGGGTQLAIIGAGGGTATLNVSGSWGTISDDTLKQNVQPYTAGLAAVLELNPVSFEYISLSPLRSADGVTNYGLMASEVQPVLPEMVSAVDLNLDGIPDPIQTLAPTHLVYVLLNAIKELEARVRQLETPAGDG